MRKLVYGRDNVDWIEEEEVLRKIQEVMLELPEKCREVCRRRFFEGKKFEEIAEELDISESTARVQTHRGMEMLRIILQNVEAAFCGI